MDNILRPSEPWIVRFFTIAAIRLGSIVLREEWGINEFWLTDTSECDWFGIQCSNMDGLSSVIALDLDKEDVICCLGHLVTSNTEQ